ncbi:uncharacterized protein LOC119089997 [Pollicipes pollicipes]|uniref:uncharacterized protein LOC119089997 n=1 Tax=Pollicipes pollicipes TaxID=41117 RepID=UPI001884F49E|nr:uncharacterized protein LOC119089997 [Pollicipes pollicipes]
MPALRGNRGALPPPPGPRHGRELDNLIRDLQRLDLSQCLDQLYSDISQLNHMEQQLGTWSGLYVRCPDPEPDELGHDPADKKSSSGYSTESASPPESRDVSDDVAGGGGGSGGAGAGGGGGAVAALVYPVCCETEVKRRLGDDAGSPCGAGALARPRHRTAVSFCPAAASTPRSQCPPRSPKTLRFAATTELIAPDSPSCRQVAAGTPRPGILRVGRQEARPAAERVGRVVSELSRLEAELSGSAGRAYGTGQFVSSPRRPTALEEPSPSPAPLDPLVLVRDGTNAASPEPDEGAAAVRPALEASDSSAHDLVRWRT